VEVFVRTHPLHIVKQDLQLHGHCLELLLAPLSETAVAAYLVERFPGHRRFAASGGSCGTVEGH
jgi:hypothetical protein